MNGLAKSDAESLAEVRSETEPLAMTGPSRGSASDAGAAAGELTGAIVGGGAGPVGAIVGMVVGAIAGALAGKVIDQEHERHRVHDAELDDVIGVTHGDLGMHRASAAKQQKSWRPLDGVDDEQ